MKTILTVIALSLTSVVVAPPLWAEPTPSSKDAPPVQRNYTLVFSDDFTTNPNTNGNWTVFRRQNDINAEGYWDPTSLSWYLTTQKNNLATAAFANYELTATIWKVDFKYKVDNSRNGADGFVFMFYKDKGAYGVPDSGTYMAFQTRNPNNSDNPVPGYGLQFDTYQYATCDPLTQNYIAIVEDVICKSQMVYQPLTTIDDNIWHSVEFRFTNGKMECTIDGKTLQGFILRSPDYTYTGIGFGAGTGANISNQIIDDFQIWIAE